MFIVVFKLTSIYILLYMFKIDLITVFQNNVPTN